ncbi:hypothetical protein ACQ5ES_01885 [Pseudidiomarina sp. E22-M8]|uniref:hypothetical protein n=1 Tax=Pseudidiomarina sp. E22-M8 TaxID=3424768 RepID=UPI00403CA15C
MIWMAPYSIPSASAPVKMAARAAGMRTVLARYGYIGAEEQPENWAADYEIQQPLQLLQHLRDYHI